MLIFIILLYKIVLVVLFISFLNIGRFLCHTSSPLKKKKKKENQRWSPHHSYYATKENPRQQEGQPINHQHQVALTVRRMIAFLTPRFSFMNKTFSLSVLTIWGCLELSYLKNLYGNKFFLEPSVWTIWRRLVFSYIKCSRRLPAKAQLQATSIDNTQTRWIKHYIYGAKVPKPMIG